MTIDTLDMRLDILNMAWAAGSGHIGGSFSAMEILKVLYFERMRIRPNEPDWEERDRMVLSKGHAAPALYVCLAHRGFFSPDVLPTLREMGSILQGHPCMFKCPGVDLSTGSLGLGLSAGVGMALALRESAPESRVYVLLGDGELQEGQNYEAIMAMNSFSLTNLTPIVDWNGVQLDGTTEEIQPHQTPLTERLSGFGLKLFEADGHDEDAIRAVLSESASCRHPHMIIAHTVKGKGVSFMEGKAAWHGKPLTKEEYDLAKKELEERKRI